MGSVLSWSRRGSAESPLASLLVAFMDAPCALSRARCQHGGASWGGTGEMLALRVTKVRPDTGGATPLEEHLSEWNTEWF